MQPPTPPRRARLSSMAALRDSSSSACSQPVHDADRARWHTISCSSAAGPYNEPRSTRLTPPLAVALGDRAGGPAARAVAARTRRHGAPRAPQRRPRAGARGRRPAAPVGHPGRPAAETCVCARTDPTRKRRGVRTSAGGEARPRAVSRPGPAPAGRSASPRQPILGGAKSTVEPEGERARSTSTRPRPAPGVGCEGVQRAVRWAPRQQARGHSHQRSCVRGRRGLPAMRQPAHRQRANAQVTMAI